MKKRKIKIWLLISLFLFQNIIGGLIPLSFGSDVEISATVNNIITPSSPTVNTPTTCTEGTSMTITLTVVPLSPHEEYFYEISNDNFLTILGNSGWITNLSYTFSTLTLDRTYYYRTKARESISFQESDYSNIVSSIQRNSCIVNLTPFTPPPVIHTCSDSDNGKNYTVQGIVSIDNAQQATDACNAENTQLQEYWCATSASESSSSEWVACQYGCNNGKCLEKPANTNVNQNNNLNQNGNGNQNINLNTNINRNNNINGNGNDNVNAPQPPEALNFSITPSYITNKTPVTLIAEANNASSMCLWGDISGNPSIDKPFCIPYASSYKTNITTGDGKKNIFIYFKNNEGKISTTLSVSLLLDTISPPNPLFTIKPSPSFTRSVKVLLENNRETPWIYISGDVMNGASTYTWTANKTEYDVVLVGDYGEKTITLQAKDEAGNVSSSISHSIVYMQEKQVELCYNKISITVNESTVQSYLNQGASLGKCVVPEITNVNSAPNLPSNENVNTIQQGNLEQDNSNIQYNANQSVPANINTNTNIAPIIENLENKDSDNDTLSDYDEITYYKTDPNNPDTDNDGLRDDEEINQYHTNPLNKDTDRDFLQDGDEINTYTTNPLIADTDQDKCMDGTEISQKTNPLDKNSQRCNVELIPIQEEKIENTLTTSVAEKKELSKNDISTITAQKKIGGIGQQDSDKDGLSDYLEMTLGTDINKMDTDNDGFTDGQEVLEYGTNPLDPDDNPRTNISLKITNWKDGDTATGSSWFIKGSCKYPSTVKLTATDEKNIAFPIGETICQPEQQFILSAEKELRDGYFTLLAQGYDDTDYSMPDSTFSVSIMVDKTKAQDIPSPKIKAIDDIVVDENVHINLQDNMITINNNFPTVLGYVEEYGINVQATFQSIITSSSIMVDSTSGYFSITSPEKLEEGLHHVTLYASKGTHSAAVTIPFIITAKDSLASSSQDYWTWIVLVLLGISISYTIWYYNKEKDHHSKKRKRL